MKTEGNRVKWETLPNLGLPRRSAIQVLLWRGLCWGGRSLPICAFCMYCVLTSSSSPGPGGWPRIPYPSPIHVALIIKFSIFGVLVSYFPGTERSSERDWKQFCSQVLPPFPPCLPFIPPYSLGLPTLLQPYLSISSPAHPHTRFHVWRKFQPSNGGVC